MQKTHKLHQTKTLSLYHMCYSTCHRMCTIYIPKGTIVVCPDESEPEVDVIEVAETIEEVQETMQYKESPSK